METPILESAVPRTLTFYRGGLNVGLFRPGPPSYSSGSEVFGNELGGNPYNYRTQNDGLGEKNFGWVLIVSGTDSEFLARGKPETKQGSFSNYDGNYNKNQLKTIGRSIISSYKKGGYRDWYVPSMDELAFICKNIPIDFSLDFRFKPMRKQYISSSYVKNPSEKTNYLRTQSFIPTTYGRTLIVEDTISMAVRYVRRVPVIII